MKKQIAVFVLLIFIITSCQSSDLSIQTAIAKTQIANPTSTPTFAPTAIPTVTLIPPTTTPEYSQYFKELFEIDDNSWSYFTVDGVKKDIFEGVGDNSIVNIQDNYLNFTFSAKRIFSYAYYNRFVYSDVRVDTKIVNLGTNNNNYLSLFCRYNPNNGWYEFNISSGGLYTIYTVQILDNSKVVYTKISDGGSNKIKQGNRENELAFICNKDSLSVLINGEVIREVIDTHNYLQSGYAGVSASSFRILPVKVAFDWVNFRMP